MSFDFHYKPYTLCFDLFTFPQEFYFMRKIIRLSSNADNILMMNLKWILKYLTLEQDYIIFVRQCAVILTVYVYSISSNRKIKLNLIE